ncbi:MAG: hypothetical protein ACRDIX_07730 [Actinomycetota bacterium]|jgi:hypothetical protein
MAREIDWQLFERACDLAAMAVRGGMGGENSQPPKYAAEVFREVWKAFKEAAKELPETSRAGFKS